MKKLQSILNEPLSFFNLADISFPYKIIQIADHQITGGAAIAGHRLFAGLRKKGVDVKLLPFVNPTHNEEGCSSWYQIFNDVRCVPDYTFPDRQLNKKQNWVEIISSVLQKEQPHIINLHNLHESIHFHEVPFEVLDVMASKSQLVFTLHDMWLLTGRCAYSTNCSKFIDGTCNEECPTPNEYPQLTPNLIAKALRIKKDFFKKHPESVIVTPSKWLANEVKKSFLKELRIEVIPYGIDLSVYQPAQNRKELRKAMGIENSEFVLLVVAANLSDPRKGMHLLWNALFRIKANFTLLTVGRREAIPQLPDNIKLIDLGFVNDQSEMSSIYSSADIFVTPTLADNLPCVLIESIACGTPCLGFNIGGVPEVIRPELTGWIVSEISVDSLAEAIQGILVNNDNARLLRATCRDIAEKEYSSDLQVERYKLLFFDLLSKSPGISPKQFVYHTSQNVAVPNTQEKLCSVDHLNLQAKQALQDGNVQRAKELLTKVLSQSPNNVKALNNLAVTEILEKNWESAREVLQKVLKLDPSNKVALENTQYLETQMSLHNSLLEAEKLIEQKEYQKARKILENILETDERHVDALNNLAVIHITESDFSKALELLNIILKIHPENEIARGNYEYINKQLEQMNTFVTKSEKDRTSPEHGAGKDIQVNEQYLNYQRNFWNTETIESAMFDKVFVPSNVTGLSPEDRMIAWNASVHNSTKKILQGIPINKDWKVLEIGCGVGRLIKPLREMFSQVDGVDIAENMVNFARKYLEDGKQNGLISVNSGSDLKELSDQTYNFVFSMIVFQHIRSASVVNSYFHEIKRVLKPGGFFRLQVFDTSDPKRGRFNEEATPGNVYGMAGNGYTPEQLRALLDAHGYDVLDIEWTSPWIWATAQKPSSVDSLPKNNLTGVSFLSKPPGKKALISAIVSTYNSEQFIQGCLEDLEAQTIADKLEIIVVDSGSEQNEREIVEKFQQKHDNIKYIRTKRNSLYAAWNRGIREATGKYITNANTDDRHHPKAFEKLVRELESNPDIDLVYSYCKESQKANQGFIDCPSNVIYYYPDFFQPMCLLHYQFGPQPMWKKSIHEEIGLFNEDFKAVGDYEFNIRFNLKLKAKLVPEILGVFYMNPDSITNSFSGQQEEKIALQNKYRNETCIFKLYKQAGWPMDTDFDKAAVLNHLGVEATSFPLPWSSRRDSAPQFTAYCFGQSIKYLPENDEIKHNIELFQLLIAGKLTHKPAQFIRNLSGTKKCFPQPTTSSHPGKIISFFAGDENNFTFAKPVIEYIRGLGYIVNQYHTDTLTKESFEATLRESDLAWFEWGNGPVIIASHLPKSCPMICRIHRYEIYEAPAKQINWNNIDNLIFVNPVFVNEFKRLVDREIEIKTTISIIPNPVNEDVPFKERNKGFRIAHISRFHPVKGTALMLHILSELVKRDSRFKLFMIGRIQDQEYYNHCMELVKKLGLENNYFYEGVIDNVPEWLSDKSFFLSTSQVESQGLGIMEAMMMGIKPIIHGGFGNLEKVYAPKYIFRTVDEAVEMFLSDDYNSYEYKELIMLRYGFLQIMPKIGHVVNNLINTFCVKPETNKNPLEKQEVDGTFNFAKSPFEPFVSVLIPTYNRANYIGETIQSAINQTYSNYEIVVVDDGSTDNTKEIVEGFNSPKIRYILKDHTGAPDTRNRCIKEARGKFILWLDSDDRLQNSILQEYEHYPQKYDDFDVLYCDNVRYYPHENKEEVIRYTSFVGKIPPVKFLNGPPIPNVGTLIRKSLFEKVGYYNNDFVRAHDYEFWVRAIRVARFRHCPKVLYRHVLHGKGQLSPVDYKDTDVSFEVKITQNVINNYSFEELYPDIKWNTLNQNEKDKIISAIYVNYMQIFLKWRDLHQARQYLIKSMELDPSSEKNTLLKQFNDLISRTALNQSSPQCASLVSGEHHSVNRLFRVVAIISAHNEGDVIYHVIGDLIKQGVGVYLINHCSTDNTVEDASKWLGNGLIHIENFPQDAHYPEQNKQEYIWTHILKRKQELAATLDADWFIHHDADEFREPPWPNLSLSEAIHVVDRSGYNAIDFELLNFRPIDNSFVSGDDVRESLKYYEPSEDFNKLQIKAWKKQKQPVNLVTTGGHDVQFEGKKVYPVKFILRHYPIRSQTHGMKKVFHERKNRFNRQERSWGWHVQYNSITDERYSFLYNPSNLKLYDGNEVRLSILCAQAHAMNQQILKENSQSAHDMKRELFKMAEDLFRNGAYNEAIDTYKKAIETSPSPNQQLPPEETSRLYDAYYNLALSYVNIQNLDDAIVTFQKAVELHNADATIYNNLGVLYFRKKMYDDARRCFEKALAIDVNYAEAQQNLEKVSSLKNS